MQTVTPLAEKRRLPITVVEDFAERLVGVRVPDFAAFTRAQWVDFSYKLPGGECLEDVQERNVRALATILRQERGASVAVATHGTALSLILNHYDPSFGYKGFLAIANVMPCIIQMTFDGLSFRSSRSIPVGKPE